MTSLLIHGRVGTDGIHRGLAASDHDGGPQGYIKGGVSEDLQDGYCSQAAYLAIRLGYGYGYRFGMDRAPSHADIIARFFLNLLSSSYTVGNLRSLH